MDISWVQDAELGRAYALVEKYNQKRLAAQEHAHTHICDEEILTDEILYKCPVGSYFAVGKQVWDGKVGIYFIDPTAKPGRRVSLESVIRKQ